MTIWTGVGRAGSAGSAPLACRISSIGRYRELTDRLHDRLSLREHDVIVPLVENTHADWSFTDADVEGNL